MPQIQILQLIKYIRDFEIIISSIFVDTKYVLKLCEIFLEL